ncbi:monofunctional biosynthetic peptidoglycan transglycosylase [Lacibacterium aquatile]|uniref:Biosynthetic peptidoglycan transglycosylase n=1 Tax=Lacibacterium aquatile TaxID=1168082 RepID=A0ABW5DQX7_9PROT
MVRRIARWVAYGIGGLIAFWLVMILVYRVIYPPVTPLMVIRLFEGEGLKHEAVAWDRIDKDIARAVIAGEDNNFCSHNGVDWVAVQDAIEEYRNGEDLRGASTVTMQLARNLFLWPGGGFIRKGVEVPLAFTIDLLWPKHRIMAVYLNSVEFGPGIYGVEAASRHHFGKSAAQLNRTEATLLAAVLPNPRRFDAGKPSAYIQRRSATLSRIMGQLGNWTDCVT